MTGRRFATLVIAVSGLSALAAALIVEGARPDSAQALLALARAALAAAA